MKIAPVLLLFLCAFSASLRAGDRPNILFCISDDQSWPHTGAYGTKWVKTPGFDRVAKEGLLFHNAYTPNAKCAPSRACILTGRNSWQLEAAANHMPFFPQKFESYVEALGKNGYFTGFTAKGWAPGSAIGADGKPRQLTGKPYSQAKSKPPTKGISGNDYATNFDLFLEDAAKGDQPWCFWYGSTEPHRAYEYGSGVSKGGKKLEEIDKVFDFWPDNETTRNDMLDYAYEIEHFDSHLVRMLNSLEKRGLLDNTLVVVTADNGMPFPRIKGQEYEFSNHLPLAIMWKNGITNPGREIKDYVSFIDYAPTFLEVAKVPLSSTGMAATTGRSLTDIFNSEKSGQVIADRDHVLIGKERHDIGRPNDAGYPVRGIVKGGWLYLKNYETDRWPAGDPITGYLNTDGSPTKTWILDARRDGSAPKYWEWSFGKRPSEEMFHIASNRECLDNVANDPEQATLKKELHDQMIAELSQQEDPRMEGNGKVFDDYPVSSPAAKYYERMIEKGEKVPAGWVNPGDFEKSNLEK